MVFAAAALAQPGSAQDRDPRIRIVHPNMGETIPLAPYPDIPLTILLRPGEQVLRLVIGDSAAFEAKVSPSRDAITVRPLRTDAKTTLNLRSDDAVYFFELSNRGGVSASYLVRVEESQAPQTVPVRPIVPADLPFQYRMGGDRNIRPALVSDDGQRTYIQWGKDQPLSAVFGIGATGDEEVVNGYMRGNLYVIDRVYPELIFRIDKDKAEAERIEPENTYER